MRIPNPKPGFNHYLLISLVIVGIIINSCRKENKIAEATALNPAIAQAKAWYENAYPVNSVSTATKTSTLGVNSTIYDLSQKIKPDWTHPAIYTRLGSSVIEMPVDPSSNFGVDLKNATANKIYSNKKYNTTSFLLLNNGKGYQAYIMIIMSDSTYINNDLTKLSHNTYRKHDADFTGMVLYFTPKGRYIGGYTYKNGQLVTPASQSGGQAILSTGGTKLKVEVSEPPTCTDWYADYYYDGQYVDTEYLGTTCTDPGDGGGTGGSGSSGGSSTGGASPPPAPPAQCTGGGDTDASVTHPAINVAEPPSGGGDGGYPPPSDPCTEETVGLPDTVHVTFCSGLSATQEASIKSTIDAFKAENCASGFLYNYFDGQSFSFCITPGNYNVIFNPETQSFTFSTDDAATPVFASLLEHEFFHAYQNAVYPGGITAYGQNAGTGVNDAGFVNIEFEQAIFNDIVSGNYNAFNNGSSDQKSAYKNWINALTANGTTYPKLTPNSAAYNQFITTYNSFLQQYNALPNNPNASQTVNLVPQAFINLFNTVNPNC